MASGTPATSRNDVNMQELCALIFRLLRAMDAEANIARQGSPTGLNWYGAFREPTKKRPRTEPCWSQRLAELLSQNGFPTRAEVPYPRSPRTRCDCVVTLRSGSKLWLEIKGAWKHYWDSRGGAWIYRSYLLHPLVAGLDKRRTHTAPLDLRKLAALSPSDGSHAGLLLVGFEKSDAPMDAEISQLVQLAGLDRSPWAMTQDSWADPYRPSLNERCWLLHRPVSVASDQPDESELVLHLGLEGGSYKIFRLPLGNGSQSFRVLSVSMCLDDEDDEVWRDQESDSFDTIEEALRYISAEGSWVHFCPMAVHPAFRAEIENLANMAQSALPDEGMNSWYWRKWQHRCARL